MGAPAGIWYCLHRNAYLELAATGTAVQCAGDDRRCERVGLQRRGRAGGLRGTGRQPEVRYAEPLVRCGLLRGLPVQRAGSLVYRDHSDRWVRWANARARILSCKPARRRHGLRGRERHDLCVRLPRERRHVFGVQRRHLLHRVHVRVLSLRVPTGRPLATVRLPFPKERRSLMLGDGRPRPASVAATWGTA
jgi:hypothetical protein